MKKVFLCLLAVFALFMLVGCETEKETYEIAFVTDIGQLKDKSFNQGTWEGVEKYAKEKGKTYKYYQPAGEATDDDRFNAMKAAVNNGAKIIVCAGFMQEGALKKACEQFKDVKFVFIDGYSLGFDNLVGIAFQEEQAGYFAGYAAVKEGYTKLGFSGGGGGTNPACQRFGYGFIQGANAAAEELNVNVDMKYSWLYGSTFSDSAELKTLLTGWYSTGTEVVFSCGGSMCKSAFAAASENNGKTIGVDVDQSNDSNTIITSATKGLTNGTYWALDKFYTGKWDELANKAVSLGVNDDAVGLPTETWSLTKFSVSDYNALYAKVKDGSLTIDNDPTGCETKTYSKVTVDYVK